MNSREFIYDIKKFNKRKLSELQHKIRTVLKCYTVVDFRLNEDDNTFSFKKNYMIRGVRMEDNKESRGNYTYEELDETKCKIIITIF